MIHIFAFEPLAVAPLRRCNFPKQLVWIKFCILKIELNKNGSQIRIIQFIFKKALKKLMI